MYDFVKSINEIFEQVFEYILTLLPTSPFAHFSLPAPIQDMLGYVNYYVPISEMLVVCASWVSCIAIYYIYQLILRKINAIS